MGVTKDSNINLVAFKNLTNVTLGITSDEGKRYSGTPLTGDNSVPPGQVGNTGNMYIPDDERTGDSQIMVLTDDGKTLMYIWRTSSGIYYKDSKPKSDTVGKVLYQEPDNEKHSKYLEGSWVLTMECEDDGTFAPSIQNMQDSQIYQDALTTFADDFKDLIAAVPLGFYNYQNSPGAIDIISTVKDAYNGKTTVTPQTMDQVLNSPEMSDAMAAINQTEAVTVSIGGSIMASYFVGLDLSVAFGYDFTDKEGLLALTVGGLVGNQRGVSADAEIGIWFVKPDELAGLTFGGLAGFSVPIDDSDVDLEFGVGIYLGFNDEGDFVVQGATFGTGFSLSLPSLADVEVLVGWTFEKTL